MAKHDLKMREEFFKVAWAGRKPFEIRNNDRNFQVNDEIILNEVGKYEGETGRTIEGIIDYVTDFEQKKNYVVFSYYETMRTE